MKPSIASLSLFIALPLSLCAQTGRLSGKVVDGTDQKALYGVRVHIDNVDGTPVKTVRDTLTEEDGTYKVDGLQAGKPYKVVFTLDEYVPDMKQVTVTATQDASLIKQYASVEYWKRTAGAIRTLIESQPAGERQKMFQIYWESLKGSAVSAEGKAEVARALKLSLPPSVWSQSPSFPVYYSADPQKLKDFETAFETNSSVSIAPGLDPMLFEDIKASQRKYHDFVHKDEERNIRQPGIRMQGEAFGRGAMDARPEGIGKEMQKKQH